MEVTYETVLFLSAIQISLCAYEEPMFVQPLQLRSANSFPVMAQFPNNGNFVPQQSPQQMLIHRNNHPSGMAMSEKHREPENLTFKEIIEAFNEAAQQKEDDEFRAAGQDESTYSYSHPASYGYPTGSNYGPAPSAYHKPAPYTPPATSVSAKIPLLKPDLFDLMKPVTTKVTSKMSGLVGLVLSLLTGAVPAGLELKGFKDLLINGILKPLFVVKGGIKALIAKLAVPVISLLLINLEVLITVWWLWEECPEKVPTYPDKPSSDYNSYS